MSDLYCFDKEQVVTILVEEFKGEKNVPFDVVPLLTRWGEDPSGAGRVWLLDVYDVVYKVKRTFPHSKIFWR